MRERLGLALVLSWTASGLARAAPPPPTFSSNVDLVTIDAVVLDEAGQPVPGLGRDDFVILEDGQPQAIESFEAFRADTTEVGSDADAPAAVGRPPSGGGVRIPQRRPFAVVVDDLHIRPPLVPATRRAVASFLERSAQDGDEVTLVTSSGEIGWRGRIPGARAALIAALGRLRGLDFGYREPGPGGRLAPMSEYEAFRIVSGGGGGAPKQINRLDGIGGGGETWVLAQSIDLRRRGRMDRTLGVLVQLFSEWRRERGRKSLLLLSEGFLQDDGLQLRNVVAAAREANAVIYFVDVRGLLPAQAYAPDLVGLKDCGGADCVMPIAEGPLEERNAEVGGAVDLADNTGGFSVRNSNDLAGGLERAAAESRAFYLLGFEPKAGKPERKWRKLRVEVRRPGLTVRARTGYRLGTASPP